MAMPFLWLNYYGRKRRKISESDKSDEPEKKARRNMPRRKQRRGLFCKLSCGAVPAGFISNCFCLKNGWRA